MSDEIRVYLTFDDSFGSDEYRQMVNTCTNIGCRLGQDGQTDLATYSAVQGTGRKEASLDAAFDDILPAGGSITFFFKELKFDLSYYSGAIVPEFGPQVSVSIWASQFKTFGKYSEDEVQGRVEQFTTIIRLLAEQTGPLYVFGGTEHDEKMSDLLPSVEQLNAGAINRLFWLNVFSPPIVGQLGRDHVLSAPAWKVEELDDSRVLLVVSNNSVHPSIPWDTAGKRVSKHLNLEW